MTGRDLLLGLTEVEPEFLAEAENAASPHRQIFRRPVLAAALIALVLIFVGCAYVVMSETEWFQSFFAQRQEQGLSEGQAAYVEENTKSIGQSVKKDGYTLTVESAIADPYHAYIKLRLDAPFWEKLDADQYAGGVYQQEDGSFDPLFLVLETQQVVCWNATWEKLEDGDPNDNSFQIMLTLGSASTAEAELFEAGVSYQLHVHGLRKFYWDDRKPDEEITDAVFDFEVVFDKINADMLEMVDEPITVSQDGISVRLTSLRLHTMGAYATYKGRNDERGFFCLMYAAVVLRDGTQVPLIQGTITTGESSWHLPSPIDLDEVDYVLLHNGTKIPVPETEKSPG